VFEIDIYRSDEILAVEKCADRDFHSGDPALQLEDFDLVGERRRTNYKIDTSKDWLDESFEIKLRNHKKDTVEIRVVEHLFRWFTWDITEKSDPFLRTNAQTMEFRVQLKPDEEKTLHYTAHYSW
jgi:hypothetical protein